MLLGIPNQPSQRSNPISHVRRECVFVIIIIFVAMTVSGRSRQDRMRNEELLALESWFDLSLWCSVPQQLSLLFVL